MPVSSLLLPSCLLLHTFPAVPSVPAGLPIAFPVAPSVSAGHYPMAMPFLLGAAVTEAGQQAAQAVQMLQLLLLLPPAAASFPTFSPTFSSLSLSISLPISLLSFSLALVGSPLHLLNCMCNEGKEVLVVINMKASGVFVTPLVRELLVP